MPAGRAWNDVAVLYRKHKHRDAIVDRLTRRGHPVHRRRRPEPLRDARDPGPGAGPARHRGPHRRRRPRADDDRAARGAWTRWRSCGSAATPSSIAATCSRPSAAWWTAGGQAAPARRRQRQRRQRRERWQRHRQRSNGDSARRRRGPGRAARPRRSRPPREAAQPARRHRGAQPAHLARGPVHHPGAVPGADRHRPGPAGRRHPGGQALRRQHRELHALRLGLAGREPRARPWPSFVDYLEAYKAAGGELPTSVELSEDVEGVRLMTLYQAKGLEFPVVVVPEPARGRVARQGAGRAAGSRASSCASRSPAATSTPTRSVGSCTWR